MGIIHVLTGPDHLSALATLSANKGSGMNSFYLGAQWGVGHSIGLVFVAVILIAIDAKEEDGTGDDDRKGVNVSDTIQEVLETLVGIFMLALGIYGVYKSSKKRKSKNAFEKEEETDSFEMNQNAHFHEHSHNPYDLSVTNIDIENAPNNEEHPH